MASSINLKNISVFRLMFLLVLNCHYLNIYLFIFSCIYLLFTDYKEMILFILLSGSVYLIERYRIDFIPFGIVDHISGKYYVVDKVLYKVKVISQLSLNHGDILYFPFQLERVNDDSQLSKNILYSGEAGKVIFKFFPRLFIERQIAKLNNESSSIINKLFFNQYLPSDFGYNLGYGLMSYYLFRYIYAKKPIIGIISMTIYSLFFTFEVKFLLLFLDFFLKKKSDKSKDRFAIKVIVLCLLNKDLINNYSITLPLLFNLFTFIRKDLDFKTYLLFIESLLFGECGLISVFLYHKLIIVKIIVFVFTIITILIPSFEKIFLLIIQIYSFINSFDISLRGSISPLCILIFLLFRKYAHYKNLDLKFVLLIILIILPINFPFTHVSFIDVGQGDAILIRKGFIPSAIMIDTGSSFNYYKLRSELMKEGIYTIDHLIVTHEDSDHSGNVEALKKDFRVKEVITEGKDFNWHGLYFNHLDLGTYDNDNDNSLVYYLNIDNKGFLFTGDISKQIDDILVRDFGQLDIDFLKVAHHGSVTGTSEKLISYFLPDFAIISTNGLYGHPHESVLKTLKKYLVRYYVTKYSSTVSIYFTKYYDLLKTGKGEFVIIKS